MSAIPLPLAFQWHQERTILSTLMQFPPLQTPARLSSLHCGSRNVSLARMMSHSPQSIDLIH